MSRKTDTVEQATEHVTELERAEAAKVLLAVGRAVTCIRRLRVLMDSDEVDPDDPRWFEANGALANLEAVVVYMTGRTSVEPHTAVEPVVSFSLLELLRQCDQEAGWP